LFIKDSLKGERAFGSGVNKEKCAEQSRASLELKAKWTLSALLQKNGDKNNNNTNYTEMGS
jgi:hypothetical protein